MTVCEIRLGRWQDVLADVGEVDALVADPPYGARTHDGHKAGVDGRRDSPAYGFERRYLEYGCWSEPEVAAFVSEWSPRCRGWFCAMTSHDLAPSWHAALERDGRYVFAPVPCVMRGMTCRLKGDGPSSWSVWLIVARPKSAQFAAWGTLPGAYTGSAGERVHIGGKPLWLMRAIIRDYTRPGDLVVDPCAGAATTLIAARLEGRNAIGAEMDPATYEIGKARIEAGYTPDLFASLEATC